MKCRFCNADEWIKCDETRPTGKPAATYEACLFRCTHCGVAYSNAQDVAKRTAMWPSAAESVPAEVRAGLDEVLGAALNVSHRAQKRAHFAFETSEDAVTWTLFSYLQKVGKLASVLKQKANCPSELLLWGAGWPLGSGRQLLADFVAVEDQIGEGSNSRSEPDVVLSGGGQLAVIEVKVGESNTVAEAKDRYKFKPYLKDNEHLFDRASTVVESGLYELTRNWVIGNLVAQRRGEKFTFINLGHEKCRASASTFQLRIRCTDPGWRPEGRRRRLVG